jgi:NAD(P)-dependent dehydrogenase (short-subunit alcohol dehydrogenase family)
VDLGLQRKVVVVTGAGRGLGRAVSEAFLAEGAYVLGADRSFPKAGLIVDEHMRRIELDVATEAGAAGVADAALATFGRLDILVCNAGRHSSEPVAKLTAGELAATFATNVGGAAFAIRAAAQHGLDGGAVVIVGSTATKSVQAGEFSYRASKMALRALAESAALELCPRGIRVNLVTPGAIDTEFAPRSGQRDFVIGEIPMRREAAPWEIASAVLFLCSKAANYITGTELVVDGGLSMRPIQWRPS